MKKYSTLIVVVLLTSSCSALNDREDDRTFTATRSVDTRKSGIRLDYMDETVKPGDDFMAYVNGGWIRNAQLPAHFLSQDTVVIAHQQTEKDIQKIIDQILSGTHPAGSDEEKIGNFYQSFVDIDRRNKQGFAPAKNELERIEALQSHEDIAAYMGRANIYETHVPFRLYIDSGLSSRPNAVYVVEGNLNLGKHERYVADDPKTENIRIQYVTLISEMLQLAKAGDEDTARAVFELERRIAISRLDSTGINGRKPRFQYLGLDELEYLAPDFDWAGFFGAAGLPDTTKIVTTLSSRLHPFNLIFKETDLATWKAFLAWSFLKRNASLLDAQTRALLFEKHIQLMTGMENDGELSDRAIYYVNMIFGDALGRLYVARHFPPAARSHALEITGNVLEAYKNSFEQLDWLDSKTRKLLLEKLANIKMEIGYPDHWEDYASLTIRDDDLFGNYLRASEFHHENDLKKLRETSGEVTWAFGPQEISAAYYSHKHTAIITAGALQPPELVATADNAANYGRAGALIAHEVAHGLYYTDSSAKINDVVDYWWTDHDRAEFRSRAEALAGQYNKFEVFDDLTVNGISTLDENIADLVGLSMALKAYRLSLGGKPAPVIDGFTGVQRLFISYGQSWMEKSREAVLREEVSTGGHAPARFRVNGVVRNLPEFYEAFNVQEGDALYLPPEQRVKIW